MDHFHQLFRKKSKLLDKEELDFFLNLANRSKKNFRVFQQVKTCWIFLYIEIKNHPNSSKEKFFLFQKGGMKILIAFLQFFQLKQNF